MTAGQFELLADAEADDVLRWRFERARPRRLRGLRGDRDRIEYGDRRASRRGSRPPRLPIRHRTPHPALRHADRAPIGGNDRLHFARSPVSARNWSTSDRQRQGHRRAGARRKRRERAARRARRTCRRTAPGLVLLCVPDRAIAEAAAAVPAGPWVAHVSGATPLAALDPHTNRFGLHPLQTFTHRRGPEQLDGAWGAVTGETQAALSTGTWLAETLGCARSCSRTTIGPLPRGCRIRLELPGHAATRRGLAARGGGRATGGARPAHAARARERLRAHRPDRARGLGHGRPPPRRDPRRPARAGGGLSRAGNAHGAPLGVEVPA